MALWLGIMRIGEKGGAINILSKIFAPLFNRLFPEIPSSSNAHGSIIMNISANMLGLDNAATPLGLKAMNELQKHNPEKEKSFKCSNIIFSLEYIRFDAYSHKYYCTSSNCNG